MRTKTLLIAAAALAAAVTSSKAQTVYSQNVVGYVNTALPSGVYTLINNPLNGTTNGAEQVLPSLQGGEIVLIWHGTGYYNYEFAGATGGTSLGYQSDWIDSSATPNPGPGSGPPGIPGDQTDTADNLYWAPQPNLNPGQGFYVLNPNGTETNTFTGTVVTTNSQTLASGIYEMVASAIPVGGDAETNSAINLAGNFGGGELVLVWHGTGYYNYEYAGATGGTSLGYQSDWIDSSATPNPGPGSGPPGIPGDQTDTADNLYWAPALNLTVGQGVFVLNPNGNEQWTQTITNIP